MQARLTALLYFSIVPVLFSIPALSCRKVVALHNPTITATAVFDEVWDVMNRRYSLFAVKHLNWDSTGKSYRSQIQEGITDKALFVLIGKMLSTLKDGHLALISSSDTSAYTAFYTTYQRNFNLQTVLSNYLKGNYRSTGPVIYKVENNIGYLYYRSFAEPLQDAALDSIMLAVAPTKGLIIDIRSNHGGSAGSAAGFFSRFIAARRLVKYEIFKKGPGQSDFYEPQPYFITPTTSWYGQPICVLVNRECYSSCNDFALYMSGLQGTRLIGDQTGGGGGIPNEYLLINGWKLRYTSTVTLSPGMASIENGITATVAAGINAQDEQNGRDPILEKAIQLLQ